MSFMWTMSADVPNNTGVGGEKKIKGTMHDWKCTPQKCPGQRKHVDATMERSQGVF